MIRISTLIALPCLVIASSRGLAQTRETPQARAAYAKVVAMRNDFERAHGRFVVFEGRDQRVVLRAFVGRAGSGGAVAGGSVWVG